MKCVVCTPRHTRARIHKETCEDYRKLVQPKNWSGLFDTKEEAKAHMFSLDKPDIGCDPRCFGPSHTRG